MPDEEKCPVCERASEFVYRLDETDEKFNRSKKVFNERLDKVEEGVDTKVKDLYKRINSVDARINALLVACFLLLLSTVLGKVF